MSDQTTEAVLLTGVYGSGKSSVAAEMAELLEARDVPYAAIDLDWLMWANVADAHGEAGNRLMLANLAPMIGNYRAAGLTRFILAGLLTSIGERERLRQTLGMRLRVVRLTVPIDDIERRLGSDPMSGRRDDLEQARRQVAGDVGGGLEDLTVANDRPIGDVAAEIVGWLGWN
jgi:energy-coupling factor transporter ATP-binding protein EcfA2